MPLTFLRNLGIVSAADITTTKLGAGAVLQVVTATDSTNRTTTSTSYVTASNTLSVSITPSSASNKILILLSTGGGNSGANLSYYTVYRGVTNLGGAEGFTQINGAIYTPVNVVYLDSPSTTSSTTYQAYLKVSGGTGYIAYNNQLSSITVMEIKG